MASAEAVVDSSVQVTGGDASAALTMKGLGLQEVGEGIYPPLPPTYPPPLMPPNHARIMIGANDGEDASSDEGDDYAGSCFPGMEMPAGAKWAAIDDQIENMIDEEVLTHTRSTTPHPTFQDNVVESPYMKAFSR